MLLDMGAARTGDRLTMALKDHPDRLPLVADLLMDAAYADDRLEGDEKAAVKRMLREILEAQTLPMDLDFRIDEFDPKRFNREQTLAPFLADPKDLKQRLLELVAAVHASDGEIDFAEDEQLRAVGAGLGLAPEDFQDLVVDVVEEIDLGEDLDRLRYGDSE
jgi:tellurite resistance protein